MEKFKTFCFCLKRRVEAGLSFFGMASLIPAIWGQMLKDDASRQFKQLEAVKQVAELSGKIIGAAVVLLVLLLTGIKFFLCPSVSFSFLYVALAIFVTWRNSGKTGFIAALMGALSEFGVGVHQRESLAILFWNSGVQLAVSLLLVFMAAVVRGTVADLERRAMDRAAGLGNEMADRKQSEERLHKTMQQFRQLAENITDVFWMKDVGASRMAYVSPAYEKIWRRSCKDSYQSVEAWLEVIHPEDRQRVAATMLTPMPTGEFTQEYRLLTPDGTLRWIRDRAFPIRDGAGKIIRMVGIAEDITERHRLEREILEISDREQARIGQDLHDGLCQKLVSLAFDNNALEQKLTAQNPTVAAVARQMGDLLDDAITEARSLAQGLFPVQLEADGLHMALQLLAVQVNARAKVQCRIECPQPAFMPDNAAAVQLYRIAQEAVNNVLKHSQAHSIAIELKTTAGRIELKITDDGIGLPGGQPAGGMGLHIMDYRARTIGGKLTIARAAGGGTEVFCSVPVPPL